MMLKDYVHGNIGEFVWKTGLSGSEIATSVTGINTQTYTPAATYIYFHVNVATSVKYSDSLDCPKFTP